MTYEDDSDTNLEDERVNRPSIVKTLANKLLLRGAPETRDDDSNVTIDEDEDDEVEINWGDLNYPIGLKLFHYDPMELNRKYKNIMRLVHFSCFITYISLFLNLITTIVLAAYSINAINIVYSVLNIVILIPSICGTFYVCFLNFATLVKRYTLAFVIQQGFLCTVYIIFSIIAIGPINGLTRFNDMNTIKDGSNHVISDGIKVFWSIMTCVESTLFIISFIIGVFVLVKIITMLKLFRKKE